MMRSEGRKDERAKKLNQKDINEIIDRIYDPYTAKRFTSKYEIPIGTPKEEGETRDFEEVYKYCCLVIETLQKGSLEDLTEFDYMYLIDALKLKAWYEKWQTRDKLYAVIVESEEKKSNDEEVTLREEFISRVLTNIAIFVCRIITLLGVCAMIDTKLTESVRMTYGWVHIFFFTFAVLFMLVGLFIYSEYEDDPDIVNDGKLKNIFFEYNVVLSIIFAGLIFMPAFYYLIIKSKFIMPKYMLRHDKLGYWLGVKLRKIWTDKELLDGLYPFMKHIDKKSARQIYKYIFKNKNHDFLRQTIKKSRGSAVLFQGKIRKAVLLQKDMNDALKELKQEGHSKAGIAELLGDEYTKFLAEYRDFFRGKLPENENFQMGRVSFSNKYRARKPKKPKKSKKKKKKLTRKEEKLRLKEKKLRLARKKRRARELKKQAKKMPVKFWKKPPHKKFRTRVGNYYD